MKLTDLNPEFRTTEYGVWLEFDCPVDRCRKISIRVHRAYPGSHWDMDGEISNATLSPSINFANEHWHGFIRGGEIVDAGSHAPAVEAKILAEAGLTPRVVVPPEAPVPPKTELIRPPEPHVVQPTGNDIPKYVVR